MNILEMSAAASVLIVGIVLLRAAALYHLPKKVFLWLWGIAVLRLLVPFSLPLTVEAAVPVLPALPVDPGLYLTLEASAGQETTISPWLLLCAVTGSILWCGSCMCWPTGTWSWSVTKKF